MAKWTGSSLFSKIENEGFDYFWDGYNGPPFLEEDYPPGIADLATKYVEAKVKLEKALEKLEDYNEWSNDEEHSFSVKEKLSDYTSSRELDDMSTDCILNLMCSEGYIEEGEYLVSVSW